MSFALFRPEWMNEGKCRGFPPSTFYPIKEDSASEYKVAKTMCDGCPITQKCLDYAIEHSEFGMWGGTTERERRTIRTRARKAQAKARREEQMAS